MKHILASGSIAHDYIMNFHDQFGNYIMPEKTHSLSVNFNIQELQRHEWGAAHNIAYNLALLDEKALCVWAVGKWFVTTPFNQKNIDYTYTITSPWLWTPSAHIITDEKNNQITAFYPGALIESGQQSLLDVKEELSIAIMAPNMPTTMVKHLQECKELGVPVIFDPWQPLSAFTKEQILVSLEAATYLICNEYELALLCKMAEISQDDLLQYVDAYIETLGAQWARYNSKDETFVVPTQKVDNVVDPTWAGDAFRAWILWALHNDKSWKEGMEKWTELACACIQQYGTQNHWWHI